MANRVFIPPIESVCVVHPLDEVCSELISYVFYGPSQFITPDDYGTKRFRRALAAARCVCASSRRRQRRRHTHTHTHTHTPKNRHHQPHLALERQHAQPGAVGAGDCVSCARTQKRARCSLTRPSATAPPRLASSPRPHTPRNNDNHKIFRTPGFAFTKYDYGTECNVRDALGRRVAFYESW
jgi:hypothetical protein